MKILCSLYPKKKKHFADAAAIAVALDLQPVNFYQHKPGMVKLSEAFVVLGQCYAPSVRIDVSEAFPCGDTVRVRLIELNEELQKELNRMLPSILEIGAGVTCDGGKIEANFAIQFIQFSRRPIAQGGRLNW